MTSMNSRTGKNFIDDFLRGCDFALDLQAQTDSSAGASTALAFGLRGQPPIFSSAVEKTPEMGRWQGEYRAPTGLRGLPPEIARDLHKAAQTGNKRAWQLLQNLDMGWAKQREGDSGYQWWKDTTTFRVPEEPDGIFNEAASYIYDEMMRNSRSTALVGIRRLNEPGTFIGEGEGLLRFKRKVEANGPWDHKKTLRRGGQNRGQDHPFKGVPAKWFYSPDTGDRYLFDVFSNVHYGYVGMAAGYPEDVLLDAAGHVQQRSEDGMRRVQEFRARHPEPRDRHTAYLKMRWGERGWDDEPDQAAVRLGMHLYNQYGNNMTLDDLNFELRNWAGVKKERKNP